MRAWMKFCVVLLCAMATGAPFIRWGSGTGSGGGGSSLGTNVKTVCSSGCNYTAIGAALDTLPYPIGEPAEAAYQSDATIAPFKITGDGIADALYFGGFGPFVDPSIQDTHLANSVSFLAKKTGSPVGSIRVRICKIDTQGGVIVCAATSGLPNGGLLASSTITASTIGTAGFELIALTLDTTVLGKRDPDWGVVFDGDSTYDTNNFTNDYIELARYAGGTSDRGSAAPQDGLDGGEPFYNPNGDAGGPLAVYASNTSFSDAVRNVIHIGPGAYGVSESISLNIPPHTALVGLGRSAVLNQYLPVAQGGPASRWRGDNLISDVAIVNSPIFSPIPWRGEQRTAILNVNTSASSTSVVLTWDNSEGSSLEIGSVFMLSEAAKPTTF